MTLTQKLGSKQDIMKNWNHLRLILKRSGVKCDVYFWTKEFTLNGERHLHIILDTDEWISQKWLSDIWRHTTGGESYRVWVNDDNLKNAAGYAMKYLTKAFSEETRFRKKERRYGFSRNSERYKYPYTVIIGDFWQIIINPNDKGKFELDYGALDNVPLGKGVNDYDEYGKKRNRPKIK